MHNACNGRMLQPPTMSFTGFYRDPKPQATPSEPTT